MVRKFIIHNEKYDENLGTLYYDTDTEEFKVEMLDNYEGLHPCLFMKILAVEQGKKWIEGRNAENYIKQRMFPPNRHALSEYLKNLGLTEYSQIGIIEKTKGACAMDDNIFIEVTEG